VVPSRSFPVGFAQIKSKGDARKGILEAEKFLQSLQTDKQGLEMSAL
jgi:hypothetical protein